MAEPFLFNIAESLVAKLATPAIEAAFQVIGAFDELKKLSKDVSYIKAVLLDAEQKVLDAEHKSGHHRNNELKQWLKQIKHVFSDAENLLDEVECENLRNQVMEAYGNTKDKVGRFFSSSNPIVFRYKIAQQIKEIRMRLDHVANIRDMFGLRENEIDRRIVHRRETYSHVESDVIGRDYDKEMIIELLMKQSSNRIAVVPIVGIGGLGKTTLANFVFNDSRISEFFQLKMWVCVSDEFDIKQLMIKIINCAIHSAGSADSPLFGFGQQNLKKLDMEQLQNLMKNALSGQKFLLVLDDVWNDDRAKWVELRDLVQVGAEESKILVTTRSPSIASMMGTVPSHILQGLSLEDSLSVFVKWAFKEGEEGKYPHLVKIGREIVKKCGGVPLALRTLGGLLFSKFDLGVWESVRDDEIWSLSQKNDDILPALKISYDQMPSYLRQCFALFSLFPRDYDYDAFEVASLWGALGLLPSSNKNKTSQDIAYQYLHELISRSFIQDFLEFGTTYCFSIHDLVHDLAVYVAKDECLLINQHIHTQTIPENIQHLSFVENCMVSDFPTPKSTSVRTIISPIEGVGFDNEALLNTWVSKCKYLRILDLSDSTFEMLPRSIGKLKHLRHLNLSGNKKMKRLPDSICKLQSLEVFMLGRCTELEELPQGIRKLSNLQSFVITTKQPVLPDEISKLSSLQNLEILLCNNIESLPVGTEFPNLKTLTIETCRSLRFLPLNSKHFPRLENFRVSECDKLDLSKEHDIDSGIKNSFLSLKSIHLSSLPQLVTLPHWFQSSASTLQSLVIADCDQFEALPDWLSTLTSLKLLSIQNSPKLMSLPNDLHHLGALEYLRVKKCPEIWRKYQPGVGEYWPDISHIELVCIGQPEDQEEQKEEKEMI